MFSVSPRSSRSRSHSPGFSTVPDFDNYHSPSASVSHSGSRSRSHYQSVSQPPFSLHPNVSQSSSLPHMDEYSHSFRNPSFNTNSAVPRGRLSTRQGLNSPGPGYYSPSPTYHMQAPRRSLSSLDPLIIPGSHSNMSTVSPSPTLPSPSYLNVDIIELSVRISRLEQDNIHLRHIQAEQTTELRLLRLQLADRAQGPPPGRQDAGVTEKLAEYVHKLKPDRALLAHEALGEDRVRRFSDFPKVRFWTEVQWKKWLQEQDRDGAARVGHTAGARGKATNNHSKRRKFFENEDGETLDPDYIHRLREFCRSFAGMMEQRGYVPATWKEVDLHVAELFYDAIRKKFPEIQLCEGNWKANLAMSQVYYDRKHPSLGTKRAASPQCSGTAPEQASVDLSDAKYTLPNERDSMPPAKIPRLVSPSRTDKKAVSSGAALRPTNTVQQERDATSQMPIPPIGAATMVHAPRPDKGKQRAALAPSLFADDLEHSVTVLTTPTAPALANDSPTTSFSVPAIAGPGPSSSSSSSLQGTSGIDTEGPKDASVLVASDTDVLPTQAAILSAATSPLCAVSDSTATALESTVTAATRQRGKHHEKPWPPADGPMPPKWAYARAWAVQHPASTRQDFDAHYGSLSPTEKKKISRQYSQKNQKDAQKTE